jgi:class 3 adenylate cyclase
LGQEKVNMAVLFADVSDSTKLYEAIGDTAAFGNVREVIGLLKGITEAYNGRVVKTIGDGLMCAFPDVDGCASAAGEMHRQIAQRPPLKSGKQLTIRVGFHYGPVIQDGDDVFGDSVNVAARMAGLALAGQAITDAETVGALSSSLRDTVRQINALPVKGKAEEIEVHELMWQASVDRTVIPGRTAAPSIPSRPSTGPKMKVIYRGREIIARDTIFLGRDDSNTIFIMDPMASRRHAKIELRAGKFVLIDQSSNGTFVTFAGSQELRLRREEVILHGKGKMAFGHSLVDNDVEMVEFDCG